MCLGDVCAVAVDARANTLGRSDERCIVKPARVMVTRILDARFRPYCLPSYAASMVLPFGLAVMLVEGPVVMLVANQ